MKIVVNRCYGGFSLSEKAVAELGGDWHEYGLDDPDDPFSSNWRTDPKLIEVVERLGEEADGRFAMLEVVEIPDDVDWTICQYDGNEWVAEKHRTW